MYAYQVWYVDGIHVRHLGCWEQRHSPTLLYMYVYETLGLSMEIFKYEYNLSRKNIKK